MLLRDVKVSCSSGQELNVISFASRRVKSKDPIKSDLKCWVTRLLDGTVYFSLRFFVLICYMYVSCVMYYTVQYWPELT